MTLLFFDACQDAFIMPKPEYTPGNLWTAVTTGRSGETNGAATISSANFVDLGLPTTAATCILGHAFKVDAAGLGNTSLWVGFQDTAFTTQVVLVTNTSGFIEVRRTSGTGTLLGTTSGHTPLSANVFAHVAAKVVLHTSTGSVIVQINGVTYLTLTGVVTSSTISNVARIRWNSTTSRSISVDDLYVCDVVDATATQGQANNDFLGDLKVLALFPTAAGDTTQWTPSTGFNWATVDETPPNTTDYVSDSTSGHRDLYNLTDTSGTATVYAVREVVYAGKSDAGAVQVKPVIKENATVTSDTAAALAVAFGTICGTMKAVRPSDSTVWTMTDLNALQAGVEVA